MVNIVIDCNVLISAGLTNGVCRQVIFKVIKDHQLIVSDLILAEYKTVTARPKFVCVKDTLLEFISIIESAADKVDDFILPDITIPDPKDLIYLCAAINSQAQYLITGNIKDFPDLKYVNVKILLPNEFLLKEDNEYVPFIVEDFIKNPVALARIKAGMTQKELASLMGDTQRYISQLENSTNVSAEAMLKVTNALEKITNKRSAE